MTEEVLLFNGEVIDGKERSKGNWVKRFLGRNEPNEPVSLARVEQSLVPTMHVNEAAHPTAVKESRSRLRTAEETTRITVTIGKKTGYAIELLAGEKGVTKSAAINYVLAKGFVIEGLQAKGAVIYAVMPNGERVSLKEIKNGELRHLVMVPAEK